MSAETIGRHAAALTVAGFAGGLVAVGALRYAGVHSAEPPAVTALATPLYVALTIAAAIALPRTGVPLHRLGFSLRIGVGTALALTVAGVALLQLAGAALAPLWEQLFGAGRDFSRFDADAMTGRDLARLLALNWTLAAFGEELAFRVLLMRGLTHALGDRRAAPAIALVVQAVVFGLVHAYQGPAGIAATTVSGLVYGALTLAARGSLWPAALAHGASNTIGILRLWHG